MTKEEAREILRRYRNLQTSDDDPEMSVALEFARSDAELGAFLSRQKAFHARVQSGLLSFSPPADLKLRILKAEKQARKRIDERYGTVPFPWRMLAPLAAAALFAVLLSTLAFWIGKSPEGKPFTEFLQRTARFALRDYNRMDLKTTNSVAIRSFFADHSPYGGFSTPKGLDRSTTFGCAKSRWNDIPYGMICFNRGTNGLVWLFMIESSSVLNPPSDGERAFQSIGRFATASWSAGGITYVLGLVGKEEDLKEYL